MNIRTAEIKRWESFAAFVAFSVFLKCTRPLLETYFIPCLCCRNLKRWQPLFRKGDNFAKVQLLIQVVQYPDWKLGIVSKLDCQGIKLHPGGLAGTIWTLFSFPSQHNSILIRNIHISLSVQLKYPTKTFSRCTLYGTNFYF